MQKIALSTLLEKILMRIPELYKKQFDKDKVFDGDRAHSCIQKVNTAFQSLVVAFQEEKRCSYAYTALADLLVAIDGDVLQCIEHPSVTMNIEKANLLAAMLEDAAYLKSALPPQWVKKILPSKEPFFPSYTRSDKLKVWLFAYGHIAYKRRNIFCDTSPLQDRI
jgi:hypothetical protein